MLADKLDKRFAFDKRPVTVDDGYGNTLGPWTEQFTVWAGKRYLIGGEDVIAARLSGHSPIVLTVRDITETRAVTTDWRCREVRTGESFNIKAVTPSRKRDVIDFLLESGVAEG